MDEKQQEQKKRRQHIVPQFYLRNFSVEGRLFGLNKSSQKVFPCSTKDIAWEEYFYDVPKEQLIDGHPAGDQIHFFENKLAELEVRFSQAIKQLLSACAIAGPNCEVMSPDANHELCYFIAVQHLRTLEVRHLMEEIARKGAISGNVDSADGKTLAMKPETLAMYQTSLLFSRDTLLPTLKIFNDRSWFVVRNCTEMPFITSDHPVVAADRSGKIAAIRSDASFVYVPISPLYLLMGAPTSIENQLPPKNTIITAKNLRDVWSLNRLQVVASTEQIFSAHNQFQEVIKYLNKNPHVAKKDRDRIKRTGEHSWEVMGF